MMWKFKKNTEYVIIIDGDAESNLKFDIDDFEDEVLVRIDTLKISFQVSGKDPEEIHHVARLTLESYFKYWIDKGVKTFINHMLDLGFTLGKPDESYFKQPFGSKRIPLKNKKTHYSDKLSFHFPD